MLHRSSPFLKGLRLLHSGGQAHFENIDRGIYIPIMSRLAFRAIIVPIVVVSSVVPFECYLTNISFIVAVLEKDIGDWVASPFTTFVFVERYRYTIFFRLPTCTARRRYGLGFVLRFYARLTLCLLKRR